MRPGRAGWLLSTALVFLVVSAGACGPEPARSPRSPEDGAAIEGPSRAADEIIRAARTPEERKELERARDEIDAEMRGKVRALEAEIERLRQENARLREEAAHP